MTPVCPRLRAFGFSSALLSSAEMISAFILLLCFLIFSAIVRLCATTAIALSTSLLVCSVPYCAGKSAGNIRKPRNVVIFVADGLRDTSVNEMDTPTLFRIRAEGVYFQNSHSLFPTYTMANASAIATGHYLGDTGNFGNVIYTGYPMFESLNFGRTPGTVTPFLEDNQRLGRQPTRREPHNVARVPKLPSPV